MMIPPVGYREETVVLRDFAEVNGWSDHAEMPEASAVFLRSISHYGGNSRHRAVRNELIEKGRKLRTEVRQERTEEDV